MSAITETLDRLLTIVNTHSNSSGLEPHILVRMELVGGHIQYQPPMDRSSAETSVQEMVK